MNLRCPDCTKFESTGSICIDRLGTAGVEVNDDLHTRNRLPVFVDHLASQVGWGALRPGLTSRETENHEGQKCTNADDPANSARLHFPIHSSCRRWCNLTLNAQPQAKISYAVG